MRIAIITAEIFSLITCLIILYGNIFETNQKTKRGSVFNLLVTANIFALLCDMLSWLMDGITVLSSANYVFTLFSMLFSFVITGLFVQYVYEYSKERINISFTLFKVFMFYSVIAIIVVLFACIKGLVFNIQDGSYVEGAYYNIYMFANLVQIIFVIVIILIYRKQLGMHDTIATLSFMVIPIICMVINLFNDEFSMVYPAISVSILLTYIMMQSDREDTLIRREQLSYHRAAHDELTGLLNRRAFTDLTDGMVGEGNVGVIFCDLNGLKYTNDHYGHHVGDELLCNFAGLLKKYFRKSEIFRISGDEFVVLLPRISSDVLNMRVEALKREIGAEERPVAAVGYAYGRDTDLVNLIKRAEEVMYDDKTEFYQMHPELRR